MGPEDKGRQFLDHIASRGQQLKAALQRNLTYNGDAYGDAIIKVHRAIVENDLDIKDYDSYFFTAARSLYIDNDNRERRRREKEAGIEAARDKPTVEEEHPESLDIFFLRTFLEKSFTTSDAFLFIDFMGAKVTRGTSYGRYAREHGLSHYKVKKTISKIKRYLNRNGMDKEK